MYVYISKTAFKQTRRKVYMMKTRKALVLLLSVLMLFSTFPLSVFAEEISAEPGVAAEQESDQITGEDVQTAVGTSGETTEQEVPDVQQEPVAGEALTEPEPAAAARTPADAVQPAEAEQNAAEQPAETPAETPKAAKTGAAPAAAKPSAGAGDTIVLEFGDSETLTPAKTGRVMDNWEVTGGNNYINFNARTKVVTNINAGTASRTATIVHTWNDTIFIWNRQTETFVITLEPEKFEVKFMLQDAGESSFTQYGDTQTVVKQQAATEPDLDDEKEVGGKTYTFFGWYEDQECSTPADVSSITADTAVYAKYTTTRTLTYVENSPEGDKGTVPDASTEGVGNTVTVGNGTMPGYSLESWNTKQDGSGDSYIPGSTFVMPDEDVVLYAQWDTASANVIYHDRIWIFRREAGQPSNNYTVINNTPTRAGYIFRGWATSESGAPSYYPGQTFVMPENDVNLYAVWGNPGNATVHGNSLTVTYSGLEQLVSGVTETVNSEGYYKYDEIQFIIELVGYFVNCNGIEAKGTDVGVYSTPITARLYTAVIEDLIRYIPDPLIGPPSYAKVEAGQLIIEPAELTVTTESAEKKYDGEPLTADGTIEGLVNGETLTFTVTGSQTEVGTSDNTYTLYWDGTANRHNYKLSEDSSIGTLTVYYEVAFDANGGENAPEALKVTEETAELPADEPTREDYDFLGWSEDQDAEEADYQPGDEIEVSGNMTLYAVWAKKQFTITYNLGGGTYDGSTEDVTEVHEIGEEITILDAPTREGYEFDYWEGSQYYPGDSYIVSEDHTFTAIWKESDSESSDTPEDADDGSGSQDGTPAGANDGANGADGTETGGINTADQSDIALSLSTFGIAMTGLLAMVFLRKREQD
jgi:uncharacterized repeat protein (TIGR02543 family)